jgi:signal peptide peptidase SppA
MLEQFAQFAATSVWAMNLSHLRAWARLANGIALGRQDLRLIAAENRAVAARAPRSMSGGGRSGINILVLPLYGVLSQRGGASSASTDQFAAAYQEAVDDNIIDTIILDIDSPGGSVEGLEEAASVIRAGRSTKPVIACVNTMACSGAYYLAAQATEVIASPSSSVGSCGVYAVHEDFSKALDQDGVKVTFISAGDGKTDGNPAEPLSDSGRAALQEAVNRHYAMFTAAVGRGRRVGVDRVRLDWRAKVYGAKEAVDNGMADQVGTLSDAISRAVSLASPRGARAAAAAGYPRATLTAGELAAAVDRDVFVRSRLRERSMIGVKHEAEREPELEPVRLVPARQSTTQRTRQGTTQSTLDRVARLIGVRG